jgi:serine/threonine protein kinase
MFSHSLFCEARLSKKSDVYSFGVILLEIMSGKRASDYIRSPLEHNLVPWAKSFHINKRKIHQLIDSHIEGQYSPREAMEVANIVIQCLSARPTHRPNIDEVVRSLEQLQNKRLYIEQQWFRSRTTWTRYF